MNFLYKETKSKKKIFFGGGGGGGGGLEQVNLQLTKSKKNFFFFLGGGGGGGRVGWGRGARVSDFLTKNPNLK